MSPSFVVHTDEGPMRLKFDPKAHPTAESAAKAFHEAVRQYASRVVGHNPDIEVSLLNPEQAQQHGYGVNTWWVIYEAGPFDWGVVASLTGLSNNPHWYTEPYWGFDVAFIQED